MEKKRQLFVSSVETFRDDGTPKAEIRYDRAVMSSELHIMMKRGIPFPAFVETL